MDIAYLLGGLFLLFVSGEILVRGAVNIAYRFKISKLVVGLTVVSFGTSAPELFVSLMAAINGHPDIAVGNVVGSNIANLGLVLAITILIFPMVINKKVGRIDYPVLFAATTIFLVVVSDRVITFNEGLLLVGILIVYSFLIVRNSRRETKKNNQVVRITRKQFYFSLILVIVGIVGLKYGSEYFLEGTISIAQNFGMSDHLIGVTIVAFGTSVPELATSAIAAFRKHDDISLGNLIGSNVFNIHAVIGISALVGNISVSEKVLTFDFLWMYGVIIALIPAIYLKQRFNRYDGLIFLAVYCAYIYFSFITA
jgi:cation:H+ antiporter